MSLYGIGVGGTGAKCLEAITNLAAVGLFEGLTPATEEGVNLLFVDADETNGSLERAKNSLKLYQKTYSLFSEERYRTPLMQTGVSSLDLWSPFRDASTEKQLTSFFSYNSLKQNNAKLGHLFDVLYTQEERDANLDVGFRGRPAIGSAVMSQVDFNRLEEEPWRTLIERIQRDAGSGGSTPSIVLYGSIFGGTGAAGLPTMGRLLANKLEKANLRGRVRLAGVFLLPYFSFTPNGGGDEVYARADQFMLNTEAALRYYLTQAQQMFDTVYLLGSQALSKVDFSIGKQTQRNKPHFLEVYAGLAARHFIQEKPAPGSVVLVSRQAKNFISWRDFPEANLVKQNLGTATRFAYVWLSYIVPELTNAKSKGVNLPGTPWYRHYFQVKSGFFNASSAPGELADLQSDPMQQQSIDGISDWCRDYLRWIGDLHDCEGETIQLFDAAAIRALSPGRDDLAILIKETQPNQSRQLQDTIASLRVKLDTPDTQGKGTIGLARTLYKLCLPV
jgi:hypothetical protein